MADLLLGLKDPPLCIHIQMNLPCLRLFVHFYILEDRLYGLEANADKSAYVAIRAAPVMVARLRHPDGWFFQIKEATKT